MLPIEGTPLLLQNVTQTEGSWIGFHLRGSRSNRDALGAFVRIDYCSKSQVDDVRNGESYLSRNDPRLHFGIGACKAVDTVTSDGQVGQSRQSRTLP